MRKIEQEMINAIERGENWTQGNTAVTFFESISGSGSLVRAASVYLHGNRIAVCFPQKRKIRLSTCGYNIRTTVSRMNAILTGLTDGAYKIQRSTAGRDTAVVSLLRLRKSAWRVELACDN